MDYPTVKEEAASPFSGRLALEVGLSSVLSAETVDPISLGRLPVYSSRREPRVGLQ